MQAPFLSVRLSGSCSRVLFLCIACFLPLLPVKAQISPQDTDAALGKMNQTLNQPMKLLDLAPSQLGEKKFPAPIQSGPAHADDAPKTEKLPTVTLQDVLPTVREETWTDILKATVTKTETLPITLETVLTQVETQNLPVRIHALNARLQKNAAYKSVSDLLPDIAGSHHQSRFNGGMQIFGDQVLQFKRIQVMPQIMASWTIKPGGEDVFRALAAKRRYAGAKSLLQSTLQEALAGAAQDYYTLIEARIQVENIKIGIEEARKQVALNESRLKAGVGVKLDVMRAKTQLIQKERDLIAAETLQAKMEQALLTRLDLDADVTLATEGLYARPQTLVPLTYDTDALIDMAAASNPAIAAAQAELKALRADAASVLARAVPSVTVQAYVQGTGPDFQNMVKGTFIGLNFQSGLLENLGTAIPLDYQTRKLQIRQKELQLRQMQRETERGVIQAYLDGRQAAQSILAAWRELEVSEEAYRLAVGRFRAGLGINVDVLDAQTALSAARTGVAQATIAFNRSQINLLQALGRVSRETLLYGVQPPKLSNRKSTHDDAKR